MDRARLESQGVAIEADFIWPAGGRSIYFRDPSGTVSSLANRKSGGFLDHGHETSRRRPPRPRHSQSGQAERVPPELLQPFGIEIVSAGELGLAEPEETGTTFEQNAFTKAHASASASGLIALSDDFGLCCDALDGAPAVYTADWAIQSDGTRNWVNAMQKVEDALQVAPA